jgi:hypothetical protein
MVAWLKRYASIIIVSATAIALVLFPDPWCFDCEGSGWGVVSAATGNLRADVLTYWFLSISILAGLLKIHRPWLVPLGIVLAELLTQHLGGVAWWSLRDNEGPMILIIGLSCGFGALAVGFCCRLAFDLIGRRNPARIQYPRLPIHPLNNRS